MMTQPKIDRTARWIQVVRESFAQIESRGTIASLVFYQRLFTLDPSLRAFFQHDIERQAEKLMQVLRFAVATLDNPRALVPELEALGRRHVHYGVRDEHYATVGVALIDTVARLLGPAFTPEVEEAWTAVLAFMSETMKNAAAAERNYGGRP
jgi:hemoglobin-like flavoprotein